MTNWIANINFFGKYTFIRKIQCDLFGHNWFTWIKQNNKNWCAWCARYTEQYPKMRKRIERSK